MCLWDPPGIQFCGKICYACATMPDGATTDPRPAFSRCRRAEGYCFVSPFIRLKRAVRPVLPFGWFRRRGKADDPVLAALAKAPVVNEPLTDDERRIVADGWEAYRRGETISAAEAKRECLAPEDPGRAPPGRAVAGGTN